METFLLYLKAFIVGGFLCAVGEALIELMLQPHQVETGSGGGGSDNRGWRDDDKDKDNNKNRTYKRRR